MKPFAFLLIFISLALPAAAQSTITLEDFDLGGDTKPATSASRDASAPAETDMEKCLLDQAACSNSEFKSNTALSMDDVVNLKLVDREGAASPPPPVGGSSETASSAPLPTIDMEILFDYNSASLRPDQAAKITELSRILSQDKFKNYRFLLLGHTDAKGSAQYNLALSQQRAQTVAGFVAAWGGLSEQRVLASGMGASRLKDQSDPYGEQNRRVQLVLLPVN
jgi:outer membrane protein OmpA-like peptidoglycan-associated protein|nr:OmpA family protein [Pseudomonadota bacterium]